MQFVRKGDRLVVTKLDRLARSIPDLAKILAHLEEKEATLRKQEPHHGERGQKYGRFAVRLAIW